MINYHLLKKSNNYAKYVTDIKEEIFFFCKNKQVEKQTLHFSQEKLA